MEFKMNNCFYAIKEVSQEELQKEIADEVIGRASCRERV